MREREKKENNEVEMWFLLDSRSSARKVLAFPNTERLKLKQPESIQ